MNRWHPAGASAIRLVGAVALVIGWAGVYYAFQGHWLGILLALVATGVTFGAARVGDLRARAQNAALRDALASAERATLVALRFVDSSGATAASYPDNPNGSPGGITSLTTPDGRATILMPHPERAFRTVALSYHPRDWGEASPWLRMFENARVWIG